jgi:hypothetical protein
MSQSFIDAKLCLAYKEKRNQTTWTNPRLRCGAHGFRRALNELVTFMKQASHLFWRALTLSALPIVVVGSFRLTAAETKYQPTWESLDKRPAPEWFLDAKFGIFIHWGVYSVPSWGVRGDYAEWYWNHIRDKKADDPWWRFHKANYGENFDYMDFAPMFRAELFDPEQWAEIFARSGAKYVVPTSKHHEGYAIWPSEEASRSWGRPWNSMAIGPSAISSVTSARPCGSAA